MVFFFFCNQRFHNLPFLSMVKTHNLGNHIREQAMRTTYSFSIKTAEVLADIAS
jgi:hypothetical protein